MRARIGIVLCVFVLWGGSLEAQPAPRDSSPIWTSWAQWVDLVHSWLTQAWVQPGDGARLQAETAPVKAEPALEPVAQTETCPPGEAWASCSLDPDG